MSPPDVFSLPIFLVTFRESLETVIIVSVLLAFLKQTVFPQDRTLYKKLVRQVWLGTGAGFLLTLLISAILIGVFYTTGASSWDGSELKYEGAFSLVAAVIISVVGAALLRVGRMREKWAGKLAKSINDYNKDGGGGGGGGGNGGKGAMMMMWRRVKSWTERYFMLVLPFVTVLREGIEAIVFIAGVTFSAPATAVPLAAVVGLAVGAIAGWVLYK
jgi:high-affinity iron transporter